MPITVDKTQILDNSSWRRNNTLWNIEKEVNASDRLRDDKRNITLRLYEKPDSMHLFCDLLVDGV